MEKKSIPLPVAVGGAVLALLLIFGFGFWYLNKQSGPTAEESKNYLEDNQKQLQNRAPISSGSSSSSGGSPPPPGPR